MALNPEEIMGIIMASTFLIIMVIIAIIVGIIMYVYYSIAQMTIAKKLKHPYPWLAWIPIARTAQFLQMGNFHWAWIFLFLLPIFGWAALFIMGIVAYWRVCEKRNYPGWLSLVRIAFLIPAVNGLATIAEAVIFGIVAWRDQ